MNFNRLLMPYEQGGIEHNKKNRTMGTIIDYLLNKKGYPLDIVGAAIFTVFFWLDTGGEFKGDGSYGSKGKELVTAIRIKCDELLALKTEGIAYQVFIEQFAKDLPYYVVPGWKRKFFKWWTGRDVFR